MSNTNKVIVGLVAVIFLAVAVVFVTTSYVDTKISKIAFPSESVGAAVSPNTHSFFKAGMTAGGRVATTTSKATYTTNVIDFVGTPTVWSVTPNLNTTISLSSTSTFPYVPNVGDVSTIYVRNASSTAASTITFAAVNANLDLQKNEVVADLALAGLDWAKITLIRTSGSVVTAIYDEFTEAD